MIDKLQIINLILNILRKLKDQGNQILKEFLVSYVKQICH